MISGPAVWPRPEVSRWQEGRRRDGSNQAPSVALPSPPPPPPPPPPPQIPPEAPRDIRRLARSRQTSASVIWAITVYIPFWRRSTAPLLFSSQVALHVFASPGHRSRYRATRLSELEISFSSVRSKLSLSPLGIDYVDEVAAMRCPACGLHFFRRLYTS